MIHSAMVECRCPGHAEKLKAVISIIIRLVTQPACRLTKEPARTEDSELVRGAHL